MFKVIEWHQNNDSMYFLSVNGQWPKLRKNIDDKFDWFTILVSLFVLEILKEKKKLKMTSQKLVIFRAFIFPPALNLKKSP